MLLEVAGDRAEGVRTEGRLKLESTCLHCPTSHCLIRCLQRVGLSRESYRGARVDRLRLEPRHGKQGAEVPAAMLDG